MLVYAGFQYVENRRSKKHIFWRCARYQKYQCRARVVTSTDEKSTGIRRLEHNHTHLPAKYSEEPVVVEIYNAQQGDCVE